MNLYDSYNKAQRIKKSLSADAVQGFKLDTTQTPQVCDNDVGVSSFLAVLQVGHQLWFCLPLSEQHLTSNMHAIYTLLKAASVDP